LNRGGHSRDENLRIIELSTTRIGMSDPSREQRQKPF
jgi:hypothetical protein